MPESSRNWFKDIFIISLILGTLFSFFIGSRPLAPPDEGRYSEIPREMIASGDYVTPTLDGIVYFEKPVLFYWMQTVSIKAFGLHEWSLRLVTALMGLAGCVLTYWGARKVYDRATGLLAALLLGSSLLYAGLAQFITIDMTLTTFMTACLLCFLVGNQQPAGKNRRLYLLLMYSFAALATLTKGLIGIIFPAMIIFLWLCVTRRWRRLPSYALLSGTGLFLLIALPWHLLVQWKNPEFFHFYFVEQHFLRYFTDYASRSQPIWFFPVILLIGFFPWTGFLLCALKHFANTWKNPKNHPTEIFLMLWAGAIFIFYMFSKSQLSPYLLPIFPPLAILTSRFILTAAKKPIKIGYMVSLIVALLLIPSAILYVRYNQAPESLAIYLITALPLFFLISLYYFNKHSKTCALLPACSPHRKYNKINAIPTKYLKMSVAWHIIGSIYILVIASVCYHFVEKKSVKPLALKLNTIMTPNDTVYNFNHYYQDLPVYLKRYVKVVNWTGELTFGNQQQPGNSILLNEKQLVTEWLQPGRRFLLLKKSDLAYIQQNLKLNFFVIAMTKSEMLLCNKESSK